VGAAAEGAAAAGAGQDEGPLEDRDSSVCDRLKNATARAVRDAHRLLGDPAVVGDSAPAEVRARYFEVLDEHASKLLNQCKMWLGGTKYRGRKCSSPPPPVHANCCRFIM
jgi:hypothetical protein